MITILINGLVQGVGFRPFVYRLAADLHLFGEVFNTSSGIEIRINDSNDVQLFLTRLRTEAPAISCIESIKVHHKRAYNPYSCFSISASQLNIGSTQLSPDIGICDKCLDEYYHNSRRTDYPFINCTYCGPRFSIVNKLPYDRKSTSMDKFKMCNECLNEYSDCEDRRFHAQPIACNDCGPHYKYLDNTNYSVIRHNIISLLSSGNIVMIKGIGGYNLLCNALSTNAVKRLRFIKNRPSKPFAIMAHNVSSLLDIVDLSDLEVKTLSSWRRPILIANLKKPYSQKYVAPNFKTLGVMLPYMALQYDLFRLSDLRYLVFTSANFNGFPMIIDDNEAVKYAKHFDIPIISYNRDIINRVDDSVVQIANNKEMILRMSRGYSPMQLLTDVDCSNILGMGAEITSHFSLGFKNYIITSQYLGSLEKYGNEIFYNDAISKYCNIYHFTPKAIAADAHPYYRSTLAADKLSSNITAIWHHHAHVAAVMTEHKIKHKVLGIVLDGTGLGTDNNIWGSEILICSYNRFTRLFNLPYLPMPGGDVAVNECWRMSISLIYSLFGSINLLPDKFIQYIGKDKITSIVELIDKHINSPLTSGTGRYFDAVAALIGIAYSSSYEAELPILLEQAADINNTDCYNHFSIYTIITDILKDIISEKTINEIASKFLNSFSRYIATKAVTLAKSHSIYDIVLAGGVFQNKIVISKISQYLKGAKLNVIIPSKLPLNDASIAIGQISILAHLHKNHGKNAQ